LKRLAVSIGLAKPPKTAPKSSAASDLDTKISQSLEQVLGWRLDWIDALIPDVGAHLGSTCSGALLVTSKNADLNCQIVTVSDKGAVSLQHMWGY
jgi:hypothetical protein